MGSMARSFLSSVIMGVCVYYLTLKFLAGNETQGIITLALGVLTIVCAGLAVYLVSAKVLGSKELSSLMGVLKVHQKKEA